MTLVKPDEGTIKVDGDYLTHEEKNGKLVPAGEKHIREVRKNIGMVFQQFNLFPNMKVLRNITEAPVHVLGLPKDEAEQRARELLELVGLDRAHRQVPDPALRRPAAARGDRPGAGDAAAGAAAGRGHLGARPRAGRGRARRAAGHRPHHRHHDAVRDPRDELRPGHLGRGADVRRGPGHRVRPAGEDLQRPGARANAGVPRARCSDAEVRTRRTEAGSGQPVPQALTPGHDPGICQSAASAAESAGACVNFLVNSPSPAPALVDGYRGVRARLAGPRTGQSSAGGTVALKHEPTAPYHSAQDALRVLETVARHTTGVTDAELARADRPRHGAADRPPADAAPRGIRRAGRRRRVRRRRPP